jgi:hypothetical protein
MPSIRTETPEIDRRSGPRQGEGAQAAQTGTDAFARIDTDVFSILSGTWGLQRCGGQPRIDRWLGCWSSSFER